MVLTGRGARSALVTAAVALSCAGCGAGTAVQAATTQPSVAPAASDPTPAPNLPGPGHSRLVTASPGAVNPRPTGWAQAQTLPGNTVRLYFWSGACSQVDH